MRVLPCALCLLCALVAGCAAPSDRGAQRDGWIVAVREVHAQADLERDPVQGHLILEGVLRRDVPKGISSEDRRRVLQDLYFRLALLSLQLGDGARAAREASSGLTLGETQDEFAANLWIVRGRAEATLGQARQAASAYAHAMSIHERLLDSALRGAP